MSHRGNGPDINYFGSNTPNKPYLTMGFEGKLYGYYGRSNGTYKDAYGNYRSISLNNKDYGLIDNARIVGGFDLITYLQNL